ncbi:MAG: hypothetical protein U9R39_06410 [Campylobacterota bacterium]|nr:hypothetical protein [Campylobacterota bacterium]
MSNYLVIGIGGYGSNILNFISSQNDSGLTTLSVQRSIELLSLSKSNFKLNILDLDFNSNIELLINESTKTFILAGLGGNTGSSYSIELVKKLNKLKQPFEIIVNMPFNWEDIKRINRANDTLEILKKESSLIHIIENNSIKNSSFDLLDKLACDKILERLKI